MSTRWFPDAMPAPPVSRDTLPWWQAAAEHRLVVQTCAACGMPRHPPGPMCAQCGSVDVRWQDLAGTGSVYSYTVVHQAFLPSLSAYVPYVVAVLDLDGAAGVRFISNLVDVDPAAVRIEQRVEVVWEDVADGYAVPRFRLAR